MADKDESTSAEPGSDGRSPKNAKGIRFWGIFVGMCILAFLSALDASIITIALPTIVEDIGGATQYVWIANSFVVAACVVQPLLGHLADTFGRRIPMIGSTALFTLGSGIAGGARNVGMLIAGRTVQGLGAGGMYVLLDIVCCDLVPLRERGKYLALMNSWAAVSAALGPPVGGALAQSNWRWIFFLNFPFCGIALVMLMLFMRVNTGAKHTQADGTSKFRQLDVLGTVIFIPSMVSLLIGLVMGGSPDWPWSSYRVIVPIVLGVVGWIAFHIQQHFAKIPSMPTRLFKNRTSATAFFLTFLSGIIIQMIIYFLPIYFQGVLRSTILESGTFFLPLAMGTLFCAVVGGVMLSKLGAYRRLHAVAFATNAIGFGLFVLLNGDTPKVAWAFYQLIASIGAGIVVPTLLPAIMAGLPESDVASSTATYSFIRTFGYVWGVTIPGVIFSAAFDQNSYLISDPALRAQLSNGAAYSFASQTHALSDAFDARLWGEITEVYTRSLRVIWWVGLGVSLLAFVCVGLEKSLKLREELETEYGLTEEKRPVAELNVEMGLAAAKH